MAYNEKLANRIRATLAHISKVEEKKMFGGLAFMINDKLCITVGNERIMCRINPTLHEEAIRKKGCSTVVMRGNKYTGYVHVKEDSIKSKKELKHWIGLALDYNAIAGSVKNDKKK
jgi:TfoX/Sxy family transcriptional regulator of competence genes